MDTQVYPFDKNRGWGTWKPLRLPDDWSAVFTCPRCGTSMTLEAHTIDDTGSVRPSVICPMQDCGFHEIIQLAGWPKVQAREERLETAICGHDAVEPSTARDALLLVDIVVPTAVVVGWSERVRAEVVHWAMALHLAAADNDVDVPPRPTVLKAWPSETEKRLDAQGEEARETRPFARESDQPALGSMGETV